jgi:hypothetical protein
MPINKQAVKHFDKVKEPHKQTFSLKILFFLLLFIFVFIERGRSLTSRATPRSRYDHVDFSMTKIGSTFKHIFIPIVATGRRARPSTRSSLNMYTSSDGGPEQWTALAHCIVVHQLVGTCIVSIEFMLPFSIVSTYVER